MCCMLGIRAICYLHVYLVRFTERLNMYVYACMPRQSWVFRYGGRHLLPRKTTTEGLSESDDVFQLVVVEEKTELLLWNSRSVFPGPTVAVCSGFHIKIHW